MVTSAQVQHKMWNKMITHKVNTYQNSCDLLWVRSVGSNTIRVNTHGSSCRHCSWTDLSHFFTRIAFILMLTISNRNSEWVLNIEGIGWQYSRKTMCRFISCVKQQQNPTAPGSHGYRSWKGNKGDCSCVLSNKALNAQCSLLCVAFFRMGVFMWRAAKAFCASGGVAC